MVGLWRGPPPGRIVAPTCTEECHGRRRSAPTGGLRRFARDVLGVTSMEYALIAACVALAFISIAILLGDDVGAMFENLGDSVQDVSGGGD